MRYLVTGGSGFLGGVLTRRLLAAGHDVAALVRHPDRAGDLAAWYQVGRRNPWAKEVNVGGTATVLREAWRAGVERIVYTSTVAVFSDTKGEVVDETCRHERGVLGPCRRHRPPTWPRWNGAVSASRT